MHTCKTQCHHCNTYRHSTSDACVCTACSERSASIASAGNSSLGGHSNATIGATGVVGGASATFTAGTGGAAVGGGYAGRDNVSQHDFPSLTVSDDFPMELLQEFESASVYGNFSLHSPLDFLTKYLQISIAPNLFCYIVYLLFCLISNYLLLLYHACLVPMCLYCVNLFT